MEQQIFAIANAFAAVCWGLLLLVPHSRATRLLVHRLGVPLVFAVAYAVLLGTSWQAFSNGGGFDSLASVQNLFSYPRALLAGWLHYLAFDLFVGSRISRDAVRRGMSRFAVAPALILTFMAGPVGMLVYAVQRRVHIGNASGQ